MVRKRTECLYVGGPLNGKVYRRFYPPTTSIAMNGTEYVRSFSGRDRDGRRFLVFCVKGEEISAAVSAR